MTRQHGGQQRWNFRGKGIKGRTDYYIGWDVGGWNCDKNRKSRDAIVILDAQKQHVGTPWRGNLRDTINEAVDAQDWLSRIFALCGAESPNEPFSATAGIDTPLGFSESIIGLVSRLEMAGPIGQSDNNPYLYRETERFLFRHGIKPLSAIKDMIGSQATKGMHVLAKFAPESSDCGVWTDGNVLTAIEAYPSPCKRSVIVQNMRRTYSRLRHEDEEDALTCALIAYLFVHQRDELAAPANNVQHREGWIWVPKDTLG